MYRKPSKNLSSRDTIHLNKKLYMVVFTIKTKKILKYFTRQNTPLFSSLHTWPWFSSCKLFSIRESSIWSFRYRNEQKCLCWNQSNTGIRELRYRIPECRCHFFLEGRPSTLLIGHKHLAAAMTKLSLSAKSAIFPSSLSSMSPFTTDHRKVVADWTHFPFSLALVIYYSQGAVYKPLHPFPPKILLPLHHIHPTHRLSYYSPWWCLLLYFSPSNSTALSTDKFLASCNPLALLASRPPVLFGPTCRL